VAEEEPVDEPAQDEVERRQPKRVDEEVRVVDVVDEERDEEDEGEREEPLQLPERSEDVRREQRREDAEEDEEGGRPEEGRGPSPDPGIAFAGSAPSEAEDGRSQDRDGQRAVRERVRGGERGAEDEAREGRSRERRPASERPRQELQDARAPAGRASSTSMTGMSETIG
jgi:hypothetical protein